MPNFIQQVTPFRTTMAPPLVPLGPSPSLPFAEQWYGHTFPSRHTPLQSPMSYSQHVGTAPGYMMANFPYISPSMSPWQNPYLPEPQFSPPFYPKESVPSQAVFMRPPPIQPARDAFALKMAGNVPEHRKNSTLSHVPTLRNEARQLRKAQDGVDVMAGDRSLLAEAAEGSSASRASNFQADTQVNLIHFRRLSQSAMLIRAAVFGITGFKPLITAYIRLVA